MNRKNPNERKTQMEEITKYQK